MTPIHAVLFDLDGTLLDTVHDLVYTLNHLRTTEKMPELSLDEIRPIASLGSKAMIKYAFSIEEPDPKFKRLREQFFTLYENHIARSTQFFPQMEAVLQHLETQHIPWGIVTNKLTRHTSALLKALRLDRRPACTICGDSLSTSKPDPAPILHACHLLKKDPRHCLYVGDAATDVIASKAAGTISLVATYGYIAEDENPLDWNADGYIQHPIEIIDWLHR
jgi:2-phosphoglycolate phosphatase